MLQVNFQVTLDVAHALQLDGQEPALDLLPSLEQVEVKLPTFILESTRSAAYVRIRDAFQPLISTRQQVGRPIKLSINGVIQGRRRAVSWSGSGRVDLQPET